MQEDYARPYVLFNRLTHELGPSHASLAWSENGPLTEIFTVEPEVQQPLLFKSVDFHRDCLDAHGLHKDLFKSCWKKMAQGGNSFF
jgi:hypothetical protein